MNINMLFLLIVFLFHSTCSARTPSHERITSFNVTLTLLQKGTMEVIEEISVWSEGNAIQRGIVREIPTLYTYRWTGSATIDLALQQILKDGYDEPYELRNESGGKVILIGTDEKITHGKHTYTIKYTVKRHLGFFTEHDELYWNVTGSNWRLPIDKVTATVILPSTIPSKKIMIDAYTGAHGKKGKDFVFNTLENTIRFSTTRPFSIKEGFTISVAWPKGYITAPSKQEKVISFFFDNISLLWGIVSILLLIIILLFLLLKRFYRTNRTVIPLFYPPEHLLPSHVGFIKYLQFKNKFFAADIVDLAVKGYIEIDYQPGWLLRKDTYILMLKRHSANLENNILAALFAKNTTIKINQSNQEILSSAVKKMEDNCHQTMQDYIYTAYAYVIPATVIAITWFIGSIFLSPASNDIVFLRIIIGVLCFSIFYFSKTYTEKGHKLRDEIDGFELFLTTTEVERMNNIATPPTKTPALYEQYLPYAIALGVEKQWTKQFASIFEQLSKNGSVPIFLWYKGKNFNVSTFTTSFPATFTSSIGSSGVGGRGSSGGGRGGGGGGGR